jgi:hypothetical protein
MTEAAPTHFTFPAMSYAYLARARKALAQFDADLDATHLFVAALELRFGIEARLFEYIDAAIDRNPEQRMRFKDYSATKLLARLTMENPRAQEVSYSRLTCEQTGQSSGFAYTPVTRELASIHGQLGNLLHFTYFWQNPHWYLNRRLESPGLPTLLHARDLVALGIDGLAYATSGNLLNHPSFKISVDELVASEGTPGMDDGNAT